MTETQDVVQKPPRTEPAKTTLPQPGKPIPSRAYPGALIVVEGTDGSGKSTQLYLLKRWLEIGGYRLHFTEWNSSPLVKSATRRGKQRRVRAPPPLSLPPPAAFSAPRPRARDAFPPWRSPGACRSLCLYGVCAGCGAGLPGEMAAKSLPVCAGSGHYVLFSSALGCGSESHPERASETEIL